MKKPWGGRFTKPTDKAVEAFTASIHYDSRLLEYDIRGSIAHAKMLGKCKIIPPEDAEKIVVGLEQVLSDLQSGKAKFDPSLEDVHMNVETLLAGQIGEVAGKLHTARSRNDQVATDVRLYLKDEIDAAIELIKTLQRTLVQKAKENLDVVMPGYTHMQHAQPVLLSHHLMAYFWMLQRDSERLQDCRKRVDVLPLGSGALAGTPFPIDREFVAKELGFSAISKNSMDAVADRDFIAEFLAACSIIMAHLSRFSEDIILWNSHEFRFIELDDSVTTGSSIMPQKKNPDVAELVRGKTGRVYGDLISLLTTIKGLPMTYNRDLQEDKEPLFDAADTVKSSLGVFSIMLKSAKFNVKRIAEDMHGDFSTATDMADILVMQGYPFRTAHEMTGDLVREFNEDGLGLELLPLKEFQEMVRKVDKKTIQRITDPKASANAKNVPGGTAREQVEKQIEEALQILNSKT
ncbi:MAG: argininosuccinate lyase [Armatimonadota bacterium]|nr:argininosuccinate lyase [Armatimonadota bacterium]